MGLSLRVNGATHFSPLTPGSQVKLAQAISSLVIALQVAPLIVTSFPTENIL